ncbi:hypothetical protein K8I61_04010 [bacterium]|nr:hypothetical protein [bacterium]
MTNETDDTARARRMERLAAFFAAATGLLFVLLIGALAPDPFENGGAPLAFAPPESPPPAATPDPLRVACRAPCERVVECGLLDDMEMCEPWCVDVWDAPTRACVATVACDRIETECFEPTDDELCTSVCDRLAGCEWLDLGGDCETVCIESWSRRERACLDVVSCGPAVAACLDRETRAPCPAVCEKMSACGIIEETGDLTACYATCATDFETPLRHCIMDRACDEVMSYCFEGLLAEELCYEACAVAFDCELTSTTTEACLASCEAEWSEPLAICLADSVSCESATACFDEPAVQCPDICAILIACGAFDVADYEACSRQCEDIFTGAERACLAEGDCTTLTACLDGTGAPAGGSTPTTDGEDGSRDTGEDAESPAPEDEGLASSALCVPSCRKLAGCGLVNAWEVDGCVTSCEAGWSRERVGCILGNACTEIAGKCPTN